MKKTLLISLALFSLTAYAAIRPVDIVEQAQTKKIQAEVQNIQAQAQIDVHTALTAQEKANAHSAFGITQDEADTIEQFINGEPIDPPQNVELLPKAFSKMLNKRTLSRDEKTYIFASGKSAKEIRAYFVRKELKELGL